MFVCRVLLLFFLLLAIKPFAFSQCTQPNAPGVNICTPQDASTISGAFTISAAARLDASVWRFEAWANGVKIVTIRDSEIMNEPVTLPDGDYLLTLTARDLSGASRVSNNVNIRVGGAPPPGCTATAGSGINACSPAEGSSGASPVTVDAAASLSQPIYRFELWVDALKMVTVRNSGVMQASLTLADGAHLLDFIARNADGTVRASKQVRINTGSASLPHEVQLDWQASTSQVSGYRVYRASRAGGPYQMLNSVAQPDLTYVDKNVQPGTTYYYVVTAVNTSGDESTYSNESPAVIPQ